MWLLPCSGLNDARTTHSESPIYISWREFHRKSWFRTAAWNWVYYNSVVIHSIFGSLWQRVFFFRPAITESRNFVRGCGFGLDVTVRRRCRGPLRSRRWARIGRIGKRLGLGLGTERLSLGPGHSLRSPVQVIFSHIFTLRVKLSGAVCCYVGRVRVCFDPHPLKCHILSFKTVLV